jgi:hypothetical protein
MEIQVANSEMEVFYSRFRESLAELDDFEVPDHKLPGIAKRHRDARVKLHNAPIRSADDLLILADAALEALTHDFPEKGMRADPGSSVALAIRALINLNNSLEKSLKNRKVQQRKYTDDV